MQIISTDLVLDIIVGFLKKTGIEYDNVSEDGRVNSSINESQILNVLSRLFKSDKHLIESGCELHVPKMREWYDFCITSTKDSDLFIPVNIKVSALQTDNLNCKLGIYYALTGLLPDGLSNEIGWENFCNSLHKNINTFTDKDYYFLVANKKDNHDYFWTSLKCLSSIIANGNNLPFQANWAVNRQRVIRSHVAAGKFILETFKESVYKRAAIKDAFDNYVLQHLQQYIIECGD